MRVARNPAVAVAIGKSDWPDLPVTFIEYNEIPRDNYI